MVHHRQKAQQLDAHLRYGRCWSQEEAEWILEHCNYALRQIGGKGEGGGRGEKAKDPSFLLAGIQVDPPRLVSPSGPQIEINKAETYFGAESKTSGWDGWTGKCLKTQGIKWVSPSLSQTSGSRRIKVSINLNWYGRVLRTSLWPLWLFMWAALTRQAQIRLDPFRWWCRRSVFSSPASVAELGWQRALRQRWKSLFQQSRIRHHSSPECRKELLKRIA